MRSAVSILAIFFALILVLAVPETSLGEAYQWKDAEGNNYYGSKPPAGAQQVQKVAGKNFSRYSSSRLLSGYRPRLSDSAAAVAPKRKDSIEEVNLVPESVRLEEGKLTVNHDEQGRVVNCKVIVRNTTDLIAKNVLVSFEFEDGSIIPARGPESIAGMGEGMYYIEPAQLPVVVALDDRERPKIGPDGKEVPPKMPKPQVVIQSSPS